MSADPHPAALPADAAGQDPPLKLIGRVHRGFVRLADQQLRGLGFATGQFPVLLALKDGVPRSQAELARLARVEQPSMAQLLNRMERDGLVDRVPDPQDRRSRLIMLTAACRQRMPGARAVMQGLGEEALAGFSAAEVETLTALVARLAANVEQLVEQRLGD